MTTKIFALGDSWFHYPKGLDKDGNVVFFPALGNISKNAGIGNIPFYLKKKFGVDINYNETSLSQIWDGAHSSDVSKDDDLGECGEELLVMVYGKSRRSPTVVVNPMPWLAKLIGRIKTYDDQISIDRAIILISGGGNDMVDKNLPYFITFDAANARPILKEPAFSNAVGVDLKNALLKIFADVTAAFPKIEFHFLFHGYDYPPVNGRGIINHDSFILEKPLESLTPGPWLSPAFQQLYTNAGLPMERHACESVMDAMIDAYNTMLGTLHDGVNKHYVDLRNTADRLNRDACWCNELHYDRDRFITASATYYNVVTDIIKKGIV